MDKLINYLINCAEQYNLNIIDDSENNDTIFIRFTNPATISCKDINFLNVKEIKYNTQTHEYIICHENDLETGYIPNETLISKIILLRNLVYSATIYSK